MLSKDKPKLPSWLSKPERPKTFAMFWSQSIALNLRYLAVFMIFTIAMYLHCSVNYNPARSLCKKNGVFIAIMYLRKQILSSDWLEKCKQQIKLAQSVVYTFHNLLFSLLISEQDLFTIAIAMNRFVFLTQFSLRCAFSIRFFKTHRK